MIQSDNESNRVQYATRTYKLNADSIANSYSIQGNYLMVEGEAYSSTIAGFIDEEEAIKQAIYHILNTERYAYDIYDDNYGVELEQYIGKDFDYLETTIENTLEEALTQDDRITGVEVTSIEKLSNDIAKVQFTVFANKNKIEMEVNVNV